MKKSLIKVLLLGIVFVMMAATFASCNPSGKYEGSLYNIEFKGNKIIATGKLSGEVYEGTYKIDGDKITIDFPDTNIVPFEGNKTYSLKDGKMQIGNFDFEKVD